MKKQYIVAIGALLIGVAVGMCFCNCSPKIAVINVNKVVQAYPKLSLVQRENTLKVGELSQWLDAAQKKIDAEKDKAKKAALIQQTQAVAQQKKAEIQQEYTQKTLELDNEITEIVANVAKKNGYKVVFSKTSIVSGGVDLTDKVLEKFKEEKK